LRDLANYAGNSWNLGPVNVPFVFHSFKPLLMDRFSFVNIRLLWLCGA